MRARPSVHNTVAENPRQAVERFPVEMMYVVLVMTLTGRDYTACTGTLIRQDLVLTAASCFHDINKYMPPPENTVIYLNDNSKVTALKIFIHPDFPRSSDFNFAIIIIEKVNRTVFPSFPEKSVDFAEILGSCLLCGHTDDDLRRKPGKFWRFTTKRLNETEAVVIPCRTIYEFPVHLTRLCLHFANLALCGSDVGSPLICNGVLQAMYSPWANLDPTKCIEQYGTAFVTLFDNNFSMWVRYVMDVPPVYLDVLNSPWSILLVCCIVLTTMAGIYYLIMEGMTRKMRSREVSRVSQAAESGRNNWPSWKFTTE